MSGESSFKFASRGSGRHQPGRILLIQPGALGDSVLSLAMAGELARHFEGVNIEMLGHMDYVSAFAGRSAVAEVADIDTMPLHHLFGEQGEVSGRMVEYLGGFDGVVSWLGKKGSVFEGNLKKMIKGPVAFIDRGPPEGYSGHVVSYWLGQLFEREGEAKDYRCRIELSEVDMAEGKERLRELLGWDVAERDYLVCQPGAGSEKKCWPMEEFAKLSRQIKKESRACVVYLLGPAEQERFGGAAPGTLVGSGEMIGGLEVRLAAVLIKYCRAFVGHDSGPTHLAAALSVPTVAIFGPTNPASWRPLGPVVYVLGGCGGADWQREIVVADVRAALEEAMSC